MHLRCAPSVFVSMVHLFLISSFVTSIPYDNNREEHGRLGFEANQDYPMISQPFEPIKQDTIDDTVNEGQDNKKDHNINVNEKQIGLDNFNAMGFDTKEFVPVEFDNDDFLSRFSTEEVEDHVIASDDIVSSIDAMNTNNQNSNNNNGNQGFKSRNNRNRLTRNMEILENILELYKLQSNNSHAKRGEGPQLSIVNPLDVLRQRLLLELARRRMKENQDQINENAEILKKIGKRSIPLDDQIDTEHHHMNKRSVEFSLPSNLLSKHGRRKIIDWIKSIKMKELKS